ncbi:cytochrome ubiquinol oxidase subunit I [Lentzea nigeriaca]|uniref:cytochrome ubiquinol oxidase subunit I n=1 Tax=Lentzea nigeriaca TaxID=1128665 RepID=UPI00195DAA42|nr:cytochrome ubiquinol oxidase subunit I [Lentzea nigeriaca]MBM7861735.1 cytochrome d ubiquinol oxidase subunit I [Lentzea nigeriaca]
MSPSDLARVQFATTTSFHFLFVLLTLGLVTLLVITQTRFTLTRAPVHERMTRFWGRIYVINYALGIATGIVMEFQFGLDWSGLATYAGDVFGAPLALETLIAFFLESTFLGLWIFGWGRLNRWVHLALLYLTALTAYASAFWIMAANGFLQHPVGYRVEGNVLRLEDFSALLGNPTFGTALVHVVFASLTVGGVFLTGVSAYHFIKRTPEVDFFRRSLRLGVVTTALVTPSLVGAGFAQFPIIEELQPGKFAHAPGTALGFMILIGMTLMAVSWLTLPLLIKDAVIRMRFPLYLMVIGIPLPFLAAILGWVFREVGRQPWLIYGLLRTEDAVSQVDSSQILLSLIVFSSLFVVLACVDWALIARAVRRGPDVTPAPVSPLVVTL